MVAVLALHRFGDRETWLLTGFRKAGDRGSGGTEGGFDPVGPTHEGATRSRSDVGAEPVAPNSTKIADEDSDGALLNHHRAGVSYLTIETDTANNPGARIGTTATFLLSPRCLRTSQ